MAIARLTPVGGHPLAEDADLLGGYRAVVDIAARDAIPTERRKAGMAVFVVSEWATHRLGAGLGNGDWSVDIIASLPNVINLWEQPNVFKDSFVSSGAGINAVFAAAEPSDLILWGPYFYTTTERVIIDAFNFPNARDFTVLGTNATQVNAGKSRLIFTGGLQPTVDVFVVASGRIRLSGFEISVSAGGHSARSLIRYGAGAPGEPYAKNWCSFTQMAFGAGTKTHSFVFDDQPGGTNEENTTILECNFYIGDNAEAGIYLGPQNQAFSTSIIRCSFFGGANGAPHGIGIYANNAAASIYAEMLDFQQLEDWFRVDAPCVIVVDGFQSEHCSRLVSTAGVPAGTSMRITGGRMDLLDTRKATTGPAFRAAGNPYWMDWTADGQIVIENSVIAIGSGQGFESDVYAGFSRGGRIVFRNCTLPNQDVFLKSVGTLLPGGGFVVENCVSNESDTPANAIAIPAYHGRYNPDGMFSVWGLQTVRRIGLANAEFDTSYGVELNLRARSALSDVGIATITDKTLTDFEVTLSVAPGASATPPADLEQFVQYDFKIVETQRVITSPNDLDTLDLWMDPSAGVTLAPATSNVTAWLDQASGENFTNTGTPVYTAADPLLAGNDSITMVGGTGQRLSSVQVPGYWKRFTDNSQEYTVVAVVHTTGSGSSTYSFGTKEFGNNFPGAGFSWNIGGNASWQLANGAGTSESVTGTWASGLNFFWYRGRRLSGLALSGDASSKNDNYNAIAAMGDTLSDPTTTLEIRAPANGGNENRWGEILVYGRALNTIEIEQLVEQYLRPKYKGFA